MIHAIATLAGLGLMFGASLAFTSRVLAERGDERRETIEEVLSGGSCETCGFEGCHGFTEALLEGEASPVTTDQEKRC
ncbi:MAG: (Fe-S)-binding protein [Clostridia bacterium]